MRAGGETLVDNVKELLLPTRPSGRRVATTGLLASALAVGLARVLGSQNLAAATALCLLAVVVASALSGRSSGMLAAVLSFFGLNFFFTDPRHTFMVHEPSDLVALFVFLVSAVIVGTLLSRVLAERDRAERRATEAQLLSQTTARLISGEPLERTLNDLASALGRSFGLVRLEIATDSGPKGSFVDQGASLDGPSITVPLVTRSGAVGSLIATRGPEAQLFSSSEVELLQSLASQTALSIERAALDQEVRRVRLDAETSSLRAALFSSVTHDLRTPLASIKASATGLIAEGPEYTEAQRREMAQTVIEEADHLNQIVGNLLDLARMRAGALIPSKETVFFEDVIASVLRRMRRTLEGFEVRTNIRPHLSPVTADPVQIEQVLSNLLENAMRFSPKGSEIQISATEWNGFVQARVVDHGSGIPAEDRHKVFEEFFSRDAGPGRGGTGLGLAISRAILVGHGGQISAEAAPGGGTAIVFEIPVAKGPSDLATGTEPEGLMR